MEDYIQFSAKTKNEAITKACLELGTSSDQLDIQVISEGSSGFFGIGSKPAVIKVRKKVQEEEFDILKELAKEEKKEKKTPVKEEKKEPKKEIKKEMNVKCPIVWGYSNYSVGYLADIKEYGSFFETAASEIPVGTTEEIVGQIIDSIRKI